MTLSRPTKKPPPPARRPSSALVAGAPLGDPLCASSSAGFIFIASGDEANDAVLLNVQRSLDKMIDSRFAIAELVEANNYAR